MVKGDGVHFGGKNRNMKKAEMKENQVNQTGLYWLDKRTEVERVVLPFQLVETVNESLTDRESGRLFRQKGQPAPGWRNKLIWGDNKYIMASLLSEFAGKINLIYIDPPFATGADFSINIKVGDLEWTKEASVIEEKAYRDTWGRGLDSYLQMMYDRLVLMRELLADNGKIIVHIGSNVNHAIRMLMDEVFGPENFRNEIVVKRGVKSVQAQFTTIDSLMYGYDTLLLYSRNRVARLPHLKVKLQEARPGTWNNHWRGTDRPTMRYELFRIVPERGQWRWSKERTIKAVKNYEKYISEYSTKLSIDEYYLWVLESNGEELDFVRLSPTGKPEHFVPPSETKLANDIWFDILAYERTDFPTQKSEALLERIIDWLSNEGDLVADFFCGSGTTGAVAEKLGRRWIMADLSKFAIHTTRKRLLEVQGCKPFEVLNLGKYQKAKLKENGVSRYIDFILKLYRAEPLSGYTTIHGKKAGRMVHIGDVDSIVTEREIRETVKECASAGVKAVDFLGWDFEMGLHDLVDRIGDEHSVKIRLVQIPREALEVKDADREEVKFFDLNYLELEHKQKSKALSITLQDFVISNPEYLPGEVRETVKRFTDYIDYWAVDFNYRDDTFHNMWQSFRTRKHPALEMKCSHTYEDSGAYRVLVKVVDIFGNDTNKLLEIEV
jgi:DNA modification methylase